MTQKLMVIITIVAIAALMITPVMAETLTGTLGGTSFGQSLYDTGIGSSSPIVISQLNVNSIEYSKFTTALIREEYRKSNFGGKTPSGNTSPFNGTIGSQIVCTGTIGYQRFFDNQGNEQPGYTWMTFDAPWNVTGLTGDQHIVITYNNIDGWTNTDVGFVDVPAGDGDIYFSWSADRYAAGKYTRTMQETIYNLYSFTKPSGIGITGLVNKTVGGTSYASKIFIMNTTSDAIITSDYTINPVDLPLATTAQSIRVAMFSPGGIWYNSSILFAPTAPTVTPTPAPTVAPGYVRNTFVTIDGTTYATIHGSNIMLYDVEAGVWSNSTSDADGSFYIDTLPYHTINAYATYTVFANHYADASIMGAETGYSGMDFPIYMYPPGLSPGPGNINLYITVVDADTTYAIGSANVQVELPTVAITGDITGSGGSAATFVVPNNTIIKARATKSGYGSVTESFNSGETSPKTKTLTMRKLLVTIAPTSTIPPGGVTPAITVIPGCEDPNSAGCSRAQDAAMMKQLRDAGPSLIGLCIIVMFMGLFKMLGK